VSGCILKRDQLKFQKTMLRISRNNAVVYFKESSNKKYEEYLIFVVLLVGQEGGVLHSRCLKAATSFEKAKIFDIPD
jgi:PBP1b-binding outer membrane lipoprotein LpoB